MSHHDGQAAALRVCGLSKSFAGNPALQGVDLSVLHGEVHALLGENGSGKSTLIKVISGFHRPDAGEVLVDGTPLTLGRAGEAYRLGARFVHQDLGLVEEASVADNLALGAGFPSRLGTIRSRTNLRAAREDLARVGLNLDPRTTVAELTAADRTGVAIARALRGAAERPVRLLVLDEPTATLPLTEVERLMQIVGRVASSGVGVLYVTHRLDEVFQLCTTATVLRDGSRVATLPVAELTRGSLVELLVGAELADTHEVAESLRAEAGRPALTLRRVSNHAIADVSVEFAAGQITGIAGLTGSGRDALLPAIFGAAPRWGEVITGDGTRIPPGRPGRAMRHSLAYVPADRTVNGGVMELTARENLALSDLKPFRRYATMRRRPEVAEARRWLREFDVRPRNTTELPLESYSGGNQQKIVFAKWLRRSPAVFLLDEPTQGVDVGAKAVLHRELVRAASTGAAVIVSSSETEELVALCQRVLVFREGVLAADLRGADITVRAVNAACLGEQEKTR